MKKSMLILLLVLALPLGLLASSGCDNILEDIRGSGDLVTEEFVFSDFNTLDVSSSFDISIVQSDSYSVSVTTDDNVFDRIEVSKKGSTLSIGVKRRIVLLNPTLKAEVSMPELRAVDFSGATHGTVSGFSSNEHLNIKLSGASSLDIAKTTAGNVEYNLSGASKVVGDLEATDAKFELSGASTAELRGSGEDMEINASGASRVKLGDFKAVNADVKLSGASSGTVKLDGRLDADLSGASHLNYTGEPTMGDIDTLGASSVSRK